MSTTSGDLFSQVLTGPVEILISWAFFLVPRKLKTKYNWVFFLFLHMSTASTIPCYLRDEMAAFETA